VRSILRRAALTAAILFIALPIAAFAGEPSAWIVPGAGYRWIPNELGVEPDGPQFGGILGVKIGSGWALEARGNFGTHDSASGTGSLDILHGEGNLTWFLGKGAIRPYLTGGAGAIRVSGSTSSAAPAAMASRGMPKTTQLASS